MGDRPKLAWVVTDDYEGHAVVVFHHHGIAARRIGADELEIAFENAECKRNKALDKYAETGVPTEVLVKEHGWYWECFNCGTRVSDGDENIDDAVFINDVVYCSRSCMEDLADKKRRINSEYEQFQIAILTQFPQFEITGFYGGYPSKTPVAYFTFPGAKYGESQMRPDTNSKSLFWYVPNGDLAAFGEWTGERGPLGQDGAKHTANP